MLLMTTSAVIVARPAMAAEAKATAIPSGAVVYEPGFFATGRRATALDMIQRLPAFTLKTQPAQRGLGAGQANVLINGRPVISKAQSVSAILAAIPASEVIRIEVIEPAAAEGSTEFLGSIANVVRRPARSMAVETTARAEAHGRGLTGKVEGSATAGAVSFEGSVLGYRQRSKSIDGDYLAQRPGAPDISGQLLQASRGHGVQAKGGARWTGDDGFSLAATIVGKHDNGSTRDDVAAIAPLRRPLESYTTKYETRSLELVWDLERQIAQNAKLKVALLQSIAWGDYSDAYGADGSTFRNIASQTTRETVLRPQVDIKLSERLTAEVGLEGAYNDLDGASAFLLDNQSVLLPGQNVHVEELRGEAFARLNGRWGRWSYSTSLAYAAAELQTRAGKANFRDIKPKLAATFAPSSVSYVTFSVARKVGQLTFTDFLTSVSVNTGQIKIGAPTLEPEDSWQLEARYNRAFWDRGAFELSLGETFIRNPIDYIPFNNSETRGNLEDATKTYASASLTLPVDRLKVPGGILTASGAWVRSRATDPLTGERRRLSGVSALSGYLGFRQELPSWKSAWGFDVSSSSVARTYRLAQTYDWSQRPAFGLEFEYRPASDLSLYLRAETSNQAADSMRTVYLRDRTSGVVQFVEKRDLRPEHALTLRIRKVMR